MKSLGNAMSNETLWYGSRTRYIRDFFTSASVPRRIVRQESGGEFAMESVRLYLSAIDEVGRIERELARLTDPKGLALLSSARDAARAAWLMLPADWQAKLEPPEREDS
jgi:hypothetical protein